MNKDIVVHPDGKLHFDGHIYTCAIGKNGMTEDKKEGDMSTPVGSFPIREVFYRADQISKPVTGLRTREILPTDGWCDDAENEMYNKHISLPFSGTHEKLWRDDHIYDIVVVIGYNDDPVVGGKGSAIFLHLARENYTPTEGCVAVALPDMLYILEGLEAQSVLTVLNY